MAQGCLEELNAGGVFRRSLIPRADVPKQLQSATSTKDEIERFRQWWADNNDGEELPERFAEWLRVNPKEHK
jgi:hypothetical protein